MVEPTPLDSDDRPTCSWKRGGDFCLQKVDEAGGLCPHHTKLWQQMKRKELARVRAPRLEELEEAADRIDEQLDEMDDGPPLNEPKRRVKPNGAEQGKPRKPRKLSKYERLRELAKKNVLTHLEHGRKEGLTAQQVEVLYESFDVLGFLQEDEDR